MNVCDLCRETPLEKEKVHVSFRPVRKHDATFMAVGGKLESSKEICPECCEKLLKLFKKGGDTK